MGKSQLLQAAAAISPRGIYVCGNATTKAGLTVAVVKDSMTNDYAFEAGNSFPPLYLASTNYSIWHIITVLNIGLSMLWMDSFT